MDDYFSVTDLYKRGWTKKLIESMALIPDQTKTNPRYPNAAPMKLFSAPRIYDLERSEKFKTLGATKDTKEKPITDHEMLEFVQNVEIEFDEISGDELTTAAIDAYNGWLLNNPSVMSGKREFTPLDNEADPAFIERIKKNYVRHHLSNYEFVLAQIRGRGCRDVGQLKRVLKGRVDREIEMRFN
jgi:hypothetical protein